MEIKAIEPFGEKYAVIVKAEFVDRVSGGRKIYDRYLFVRNADGLNVGDDVEFGYDRNGNITYLIKKTYFNKGGDK